MHESVKFRCRQYSLDGRRTSSDIYCHTIFCVENVPNRNVRNFYLYESSVYRPHLEWGLFLGEMIMKNDDAYYMRRAISLAKLGEGYAHPNPLVGAVIVKEGTIVGEGYHKKCGTLHAERNAFASLKCKEDALHATMYVTLEPCAHYGRTPPCTEAIIEHGISKVIIGSRDPNPLVSGKGAKILREHGIEVIEDFLKEECDEINTIFFHYITKNIPYVFMKYAMTCDGKIATKTGQSQWISNEQSRQDVHFLRHRCMAILVGINTVLTDNPSLTSRCQINQDIESDFIKKEEYQVKPLHPLRIVLDTHLRIPLDCQLVQTAKKMKTIVACGEESNEDKAKMLEEKGVEVLHLKTDNGHLSLKQLINILGKRGIDSLLIEGGGTINESAIREEIVDEVQLYLAPKIFGGNGMTPVRGEGVSEVNEAKEFKLYSFERIGEDLKICYRR